MGLVASGLTACCALVNAAVCACSMVRCCFSGSMGPGGIGPKMAKLFYVMLLATATLVAYLLGKYGENEVEKDFKAGNLDIFKFTISCEDVTGQNVCSGDSAILRASFASVLFFAIMLVGTLPVPTFSGERGWAPLLGEGFHRGWWGFKLLIYFGLLIGSFFFKFFDDDAFTGVARFVSMIFLILQVLVLIDLAYTWNETWIERSDVDNDYSSGSRGWLYALIAASFLLYAVAIGGLITMFIFYGDCKDTLAFAVVNFILIVIFTLITFFREWLTEEQGSIAPAAVVAAYTVYLTWSASQSNPNLSEECDPFGFQLGKNGAEIFLGLVIGTITLVWTAYSVSANSGGILAGDTTTAQQQDVGGAYEIQDEDGKTRFARDTQKDAEPQEDAVGENKLWVFHFIMLTASFYMSMSLTNWGVSQAEVAASGAAVGNIAMYVKMAANWAASLLFIWTLVAPAVMPDREW